MIQKRNLGRTGLMVSELCLGTMTFGEQTDEAEGHAQMDWALERGINFFDTSEMYSIPPRAETTGSTERIIGSWFKARRNRDRVILATKAAGRGPMNWLRAGGKPTDHTSAQLTEALDKSLKRLNTDYIDLYQLHWPDRPVALFGAQGLIYNHVEAPSTPVAEILETLGRFVNAGKVRHIGLSNETSWGTMRFVTEAERLGAPRVASIQNAYHLLNRTFELGLAEIAHREGVSLMAYSPLAQGYLTGKYQGGALPPGARKTLFNRLQRYERPETAPAISRYLAIADKFGVDPAHLAIRFCTTRPFVASAIIGATTLAQLKHDLDAMKVTWTDELEKAVNTAHHMQPNPAP